MALAEAAAVAAILGNGANIIDKIYNRFFERKEGKPPPSDHQPEHSAIITNDKSQEALLLTMKGTEWSKVTYAELEQRLSAGDMQYIKTREKVLRALYDQWDAAYPTLPLEMNPIRKKQLEQQLDGLTDDLAKELDKILGFIAKAGLMLDDHYLKFRDLVAGK